MSYHWIEKGPERLPSCAFSACASGAPILSPFIRVIPQAVLQPWLLRLRAILRADPHRTRFFSRSTATRVSRHNPRRSRPVYPHPHSDRAHPTTRPPPGGRGPTAVRARPLGPSAGSGLGDGRGPAGPAQGGGITVRTCRAAGAGGGDEDRRVLCVFVCVCARVSMAARLRALACALVPAAGRWRVARRSEGAARGRPS